MGMLENTTDDDKKKIVGKRIVNFTAEGIELEDGTKLTWKIDLFKGADGGWYKDLQIRVNGELVLSL